MINVYLIEDDQYTRENLYQYVKNITKDHNPVNIHSFTCANQFLMSADINKADIILCDIEMPGMNGIELGRLVKKENPDIYLVYLTAYPNYAADSYMVDAEQYILKNDMEKRLESVLLKLIKKIRCNREQYAMFESNYTMYKVYFSDILYAMKDKNTKYITIKTKDYEIKKRSSLDEFLQLVNPKQFVAIDRGTVININHIVKMNKNVIYLDNGEEKTVSRLRAGEVKDAINTYFANCIV